MRLPGKHPSEKPKYSLSLRTFLFAMSALAVFFAIFVSGIEIDESLERLEPVIALGGLCALLISISCTCASLGSDLWSDPGATFVAGIFGFLAFFLMIVFGVLTRIIT